MKLAGITEIAELASISRSAVSNWIKRDPSFPRPLAVLACGPIWDKADVETWLLKNNLSRESDMNEIDSLRIGTVYTHDFICTTFGGDAKSGTYLPQSKQTILCGCFTKTMNPDAPECILVGNSPRILGKAEKLAAQGGDIPVFLKLATNQWEYKGRFELMLFTRNPQDFESKAISADRNDVSAALFFRRTEN